MKLNERDAVVIGLCQELSADFGFNHAYIPGYTSTYTICLVNKQQDRLHCVTTIRDLAKAVLKERIKENLPEEDLTKFNQWIEKQADFMLKSIAHQEKSPQN